MSDGAENGMTERDQRALDAVIFLLPGLLPVRIM